MRFLTNTKNKRQGNTATVIPCLYLLLFTVLRTLAAGPPVNKKRTRTLSHIESGSSTNCMVEITGIEPENEVTAVRIDFVAQYGYNIIRILLL